MLDRYLAYPPTITEKLSLPHPREHATEVAEDKVTATKEFLWKCEAVWEKKG
jgi:hypothetical protein